MRELEEQILAEQERAGPAGALMGGVSEPAGYENRAELGWSRLTSVGVGVD